MLTVNQKELLEKIVGFQGYCTKQTVAKYKNITAHSAYKYLEKLVADGYLTKRDYYSTQNLPQVYQVTSKACKEMGRGDAYMRKKHNQQAMHRYLVYSHFCFSLLAGNYEFVNILTSSSLRVEYLLTRGCPMRLLPKVTNIGKSYVYDKSNFEIKYQVEEIILTAPPFAKNNGIALVWADKQWQNHRTQLQYLIKKYEVIAEALSFPVIILVVCENQARTKAYKEYFTEVVNGKKLMFATYKISTDYAT